MMASPTQGPEVQADLGLGSMYLFEPEESGLLGFEQVGDGNWEVVSFG